MMGREEGLGFIHRGSGAHGKDGFLVNDLRIFFSCILISVIYQTIC